MQALLDVILPVFGVIGMGYLAVRLGYFKDSAVDGLMSFTQSFAIPCLLFSLSPASPSRARQRMGGL